MKVEEILDILNEKYPFNIAEPWDNVGLLVGEKDANVEKILVALEVTYKVIDYAVNNNFDLIITHHPMIFHPLKRIEKEDVLGYKIIEAIQNNVNIIAMHTNLDSAKEGLNEYVLDKMNLDFRYLSYEETLNKPYRMIELNKRTSIFDIVESVKKGLNIKRLKVTYNSYYNDEYIKKIAIVTGSGSSFIPLFINKVDLIITADLTHHIALDTMEKGISLIDFGHHESESPSIDLIKDYLDNKVEIYVEKMQDDSVFHVW
ncbi:Nif3-like dinuclear metal center hexameric protein [Oceanivirga miroungae]|uniref:GTP cyclohydrolase 1 type 2 homolog n=1 Tax=Oceanivirga miroungae TaxID=1130046 RepID=A0A6I8MBE1_9FUSO|nr:Nif3-like dinuclear metal center hexameric protein [Oceanivirga miroungae]VWL84805.1 GTP cyclohydrolase 1 type 2 [Oceanivirga miroungae]